MTTLRLMSASGLTLAAAISAPHLAAAQARDASATTVSSVTVTAPASYASPITTVNGKLPLSVLEEPQAVQSIPQALIRDQGITGFDEVLKNASGVAPASSPAEYPGEFRVRGFETGPFFDGESDTYGFTGGGARDLFVNLERVEVLKGPASVSYGGGQFGGFGGIINLVSKKPLDTQRQEYGLTVDSYGYASPTIDLTGPLNDAKTVQFRLTGQYAHRGSFIRNETDDSFGVYPTLLLKAPDGRDSLLVQISFTQRVGDRYFGVPASGTVTSTNILRLPYDANYSEPGLRRDPTQDAMATITWEHRLNEDWTTHVVLRGFLQQSKYQGAYSQNSAGSIEADGVTLDRQFLLYREHDQDLSLDAFVSGKFRLLGFGHTLVVGASEVNYQGKTYEASGDIASINLLNPVYGAAPTNVAFYPNYKDNSDYYGVYGQDQIALTSRLKLVIGGRYQGFRDFIREDPPVGVVENRTVFTFSPRVGVTYEALKGVVAYAGYAEGLQPSFDTFAPGYKPKPQKSQQVEAGVKLDLPAGLQATAAVFDLVYQNASVPDPSNPIYSIQAGEQESTGAELDATWSGPHGLSAYATYGYTDAKITKDEVLPVGDHLPNTPRNSGRIWVVWAPPTGALKGWRFGGGGYAADTRQGTLPNTYRLAAYQTLDAMVAREFGRYSLQLTLKNLTDRRYYSSSGAYQEGVFPGEPFTAQVSLRAVF